MHEQKRTERDREKRQRREEPRDGRVPGHPADGPKSLGAADNRAHVPLTGYPEERSRELKIAPS